MAWDGKEWSISPGGLVRALRPVLQDADGAWVGWPGIPDFDPEPFEYDGIDQRPVPLSEDEVDSFYYGFCNGTLWPLYHDAIAEPEYHRTWWDAYVKVNRRFADTVIAVAEPNATVWVHDYQLQLVPGMVRDALPDLNIGFFLHTPWPARELFLRLPWREQIVRGLLGASLIGFHTEVMAHNFRHVVPRLVSGAEVVDETVLLDGRATVCKRHPIGIDHDRFAEAAQRPSTPAAVEALREQLHRPDTVLLGVDRLDYTKGIAQRLRAYGELLDEDRISADDTALIQIAEPSRTNVNGYADIRAEVEQLVGEINGKYGTMVRPAVHYLHRSHDFDELIALYRLADVMLVTPFRDGMNLVAKEYVATRFDDTGALVLSEFAGAVHELEQAVQVNPYDTDGLKEAIVYATLMRPDEQAERMSAMRSIVASSTSHTWAGTFLDELEGR